MSFLNHRALPDDGAPRRPPIGPILRAADAAAANAAATPDPSRRRGDDAVRMMLAIAAVARVEAQRGCSASIAGAETTLAIKALLDKLAAEPVLAAFPEFEPGAGGRLSAVDMDALARALDAAPRAPGRAGDPPPDQRPPDQQGDPPPEQQGDPPSGQQGDPP
jgi:hypothetical protein